MRFKPKAVYKFSLDGEFLGSYFSVAEAARQNNANPDAISACCTGKQKQHIGFRWSHDRDKYKYEKPKPPERKYSICNYCENSCGRCSWSSRLVPVKDWVADKVDYIMHDKSKGVSYVVKECPQFKEVDRKRGRGLL